jgi:environmental stress-induced protein Ves
MLLLPAAARTRVPWKNGGGFTEEIAVSPAGAGLDDFAWRLSTASVQTSGPFSRFDGVDRILAVVTGGAMRLSVDGDAPVRLDQDSAPFAFAGDKPTSAELAGIGLVDLNLMVRRGQARAEMVRQVLRGLAVVGDDEAVTLIFALDQILLDDSELYPLDAARLEPGEVIKIRPRHASARVLRASIISPSM